MFHYREIWKDHFRDFEGNSIHTVFEKIMYIRKHLVQYTRVLDPFININLLKVAMEFLETATSFVKILISAVTFNLKV